MTTCSCPGKSAVITTKDDALITRCEICGNEAPFILKEIPPPAPSRLNRAQRRRNGRQKLIHAYDRRCERCNGVAWLKNLGGSSKAHVCMHCGHVMPLVKAL